MSQCSNGVINAVLYHVSWYIDRTINVSSLAALDTTVGILVVVSRNKTKVTVVPICIECSD